MHDGTEFNISMENYCFLSVVTYQVVINDFVCVSAERFKRDGVG
jgi:hypothetical protein